MLMNYSKHREWFEHTNPKILSRSYTVVDQPIKRSIKREFLYTEEDFKFIKDIVYDVSGIHLSDVKQDMVYSRLARRLRALKLVTFKQYCRYLETHRQDELTNAINAITTNLTHYFREVHHFDRLRTDILPELSRQQPRGKRLRIWSAGCSTGEEPYSIAMTVRDALPNYSAWDSKILATDLDSNVIAHCREGIYDIKRIEPVDKNMANKWFKPVPNKPNLVSIDAELKRDITFKELNLMNAWPINGPFDVIFCRNVVIYFDKPTQQKLFKRFYDMLAPNGYLFLGHSEQLGDHQKHFELLGNTAFQKK